MKKPMEIYLGDGTWSTLPATFELTSSEVKFTNKSSEFDVKIDFSFADLSPNPLEIEAEGTAVLYVPTGQFENIPTLRSRAKDTSEEWDESIRERTGNGPKMDIDNP